MLTARTILFSTALGLAAASGLAEPISDSLTIRRVAAVQDMGRMAVNPQTGEIAFGRTGPGASDAHFIRVLSPDGVLSQAGDAPIRDPDAVVWDMDGSFGPAGSILVGSFKGLFSVTPENRVHQFAWRGEDLMNPSDMVMGADGALFYSDFGLGKVVRLSAHGSFSEMLAAPQGVGVDIDLDGRLAAVTLAGSLLASGVAPQRRLSEIAFGDGSGHWGHDRYAIDSDSGDLVRVMSDGSARVLASGFFDELEQLPERLVAQIGFMPTGEMVVSVPDTGAVYTLVPAPGGAAVLAGLGGLLAARRSR